MNSETKATLVAAREIVADSKRYMVGAYARDADGKPITTQGDATDAGDMRARKWNAFGAIWKVSEPTRESRYDACAALCVARAKHLKRNVTAETSHFQNECDSWLDNAGQDVALEVFDLAIGSA